MTAIFALAIPHCAWLPERVTSMARLKDQLGNRPKFYKEFAEKEPNWSWSEKLWNWAIATGATHLVQLQDDIEVDAGFWPNLRAMVDARPDDIIGLESINPLAKYMTSSWYTDGDCCVGVAYVIPVPVLVTMMQWRNSLPSGLVQNVNEDDLIGLFALCTQRKIWHPVVTIVDHDTTVPSSYKNDAHPNRKPVMTTVRGDVQSGPLHGMRVPHMGNWYGPRLATTAKQLGYTLSDEDDTGQQAIVALATCDEFNLCCLCARNPPSVHGQTGLKLCVQCVSASSNALLARMVVR
jgi:hypothetical protein